MLFLKCLFVFKNPKISCDSFVKLQRQLQNFLQKKEFMVEYNRLIVNDDQIKVNERFL